MGAVLFHLLCFSGFVQQPAAAEAFLLFRAYTTHSSRSPVLIICVHELDVISSLTHVKVGCFRGRGRGGLECWKMGLAAKGVGWRWFSGWNGGGFLFSAFKGNSFIAELQGNHAWTGCYFLLHFCLINYRECWWLLHIFNYWHWISLHFDVLYEWILIWKLLIWD